MACSGCDFRAPAEDGEVIGDEYIWKGKMETQILRCKNARENPRLSGW